jgi:hypothetical protein
MRVGVPVGLAGPVGIAKVDEMFHKTLPIHTVPASDWRPVIADDLVEMGTSD